MMYRFRPLTALWALLVALGAFLVYALEAGAQAASDAGVIPNDNSARWAFLVGAVLPGAIAVINRQRWSSQTKGLVALGASTLAGAGTSYFAGSFTGQDLVTSILITAVMAFTTYQVWWKPSGVAPTIEGKTG